MTYLSGIDRRASLPLGPKIVINTINISGAIVVNFGNFGLLYIQNASKFSIYIFLKVTGPLKIVKAFFSENFNKFQNLFKGNKWINSLAPCKKLTFIKQLTL